MRTDVVIAICSTIGVVIAIGTLANNQISRYIQSKVEKEVQKEMKELKAKIYKWLQNK